MDKINRKQKSWEGDYTITLPIKMEEIALFNEKPIISKWVADIYDQKITETDDVDFLLSVIGNQPKKILEVCCGSGRILVPLAKAGHTVVGIDADTFMLDKIQAKAVGLDNIKWQKADAVYDDWGSGFDVVVLAGNILYNIVSDMDYAKAQELFIKKAASALVPGGYVFISYNPGGNKLTQPTQSKNHNEDWIVWEGTDNDGNFGKMTLLGGSYDSETQLDKFVRRFELTLANGEKIRQDINCVKHTVMLEQLRDWLYDAGFIIGLQCEDYEKNPIKDNSCEVKIYARKKPEEPTNLEYKEINTSMLYDIACAFDEGSAKHIVLHENAFALAALDENIPVGFISVTPREMDYPLEHIKDAYIEIYEVHDFYQRRGIGRYMVQRAEGWAREKGFRQIRTHHNDEAVAAIHMSYALGYGMCPHEYHKDEGCAGYYVAKILTPND